MLMAFNQHNPWCIGSPKQKGVTWLHNSHVSIVSTARGPSTTTKHPCYTSLPHKLLLHGCHQ